jgi:hypothetical protein
MDFLEDNDIQINDDNNFNFSQPNTNQAVDFNTLYSQVPQFTQQAYSPMDWSSPLDEEEQKRFELRRKEEDERRLKLNEKIRKEMEDKQQIREKGSEWLRNWSEQREDKVLKRKNFNRLNEEEYIKNRNIEKDEKTNPWDKVIENIQLKESEHKGQKDVSRMKAIILQRKADFVNLKMK